MTTRQRQLNDACRRASGGGVGFIAVALRRGAVVRRDEEYARSTERVYPTLAEALAALREHEEG